MAVFETSVSLPCPQEQAFDFLVRPANLARLAPPTVGLAIVKAPELLASGDHLEFKIQAFGQVLSFVHEFVAVEPHSLITEKQIKGMFGRWVQEQNISTDAAGQTCVAVHVEFEPPAGLLGYLVTKAKILEYLETAYDHRHAAMEKMLAAPQ